MVDELPWTDGEDVNELIFFSRYIWRMSPKTQTHWVLETLSESFGVLLSYHQAAKLLALYPPV